MTPFTELLTCLAEIIDHWFHRNPDPFTKEEMRRVISMLTEVVNEAEAPTRKPN